MSHWDSQTGAEKMARALGKALDTTVPKAERQEKEKSMMDLFKSLANVNAKLFLLNTALAKYQNMTKFSTGPVDEHSRTASGLYTFVPGPRAGVGACTCRVLCAETWSTRVSS